MALAFFGGLLLAAEPAEQLPAPKAVPAAASISLEQAVRFGLENNPQLAAIRQQHGIAAATVVLARTYPFNPITESKVFAAIGPESAGITNSVPSQHKIVWEVMVRGQLGFRKQAAYAGLNRTDFEIASQEVTFAVNAIRAFDQYIYRQKKLQVTEEFLRLSETSSNQVKQLVDRGTLRTADLILARAEVSDVRSQLGLSRTGLYAARRDFVRALGSLDFETVPAGTLGRPFPPLTADVLTETAVQQRPDLQARQATIVQAEAQLRFEIADRFGNPVVGAAYEYDSSRTNFIGLQFGAPIPVFNRKQGEIHRRKAELALARLELRQNEVEIRQDVPTVLARVREARGWVETYDKQVLPELTRALADIDRLFREGQPGADVLRLLDVRRKLLKARDGYFDAQLAYAQALCDLAQAVGDPALAMGLYQTENCSTAAKP